MIAHSPGPFAPHPRNEFDIVDHRGEAIGTVLVGNNVSQVRGNRALFVASLSLYWAARRCLDANGHLRGCEGSGGDEDACSPSCAELRLALARVERR